MGDFEEVTLFLAAVARVCVVQAYDVIGFVIVMSHVYLKHGHCGWVSAIGGPESQPTPQWVVLMQENVSSVPQPSYWGRNMAAPYAGRFTSSACSRFQVLYCIVLYCIVCLLTAHINSTKSYVTQMETKAYEQKRTNKHELIHKNISN